MNDPFDAEGRPRFCGCPDNVINERQRWPEGPISYGVVQPTETDPISAEMQILDLAQALGLWQQHARLSFLPDPNATEGTTGITIAYRRAAHGDGHPFDGLGNVVGHAWGPPDGRIHHDGAEVWTPSLRRRVSTHEAGHALGLPHAPTPDNIMYPYLTELEPLGPWDIAEIVARYGAVEDGPAAPTIPPPPMLVGLRRSELTIDGQPPHDGDMLKVYAADGDTAAELAESVYYPDGFMVLEIPQCRRFSLQLRSPVTSVWAGPFDWISGTLDWLEVNFEIEQAPAPPTSPDDWIDAEIMVGDAMRLKVKMRFQMT